MSHESGEPGRAVVYNLPTLFSDSLRSLEFSEFFSQYRGAPFTVRTGDGWSWPAPPPRRPQFVAGFRSRAELDTVLGDATGAALGRVFLEGGLEIHGNMFALLAAAEYTLRHAEGLSHSLVQTVSRVTAEFSRRLLRVRPGAGPRNWHCVPCPADLPCDFFAPWLGPLLVHCCAAAGFADEDFEAAQRSALERACEWLELERGDRLLEVGCGWGSLLAHAARHHHAEVRGVCASAEQAAAASQLFVRSGLKPCCPVEQRDLRAAPYAAESFDKIADVGIFEQVAQGELGRYLEGMRRMIAPGGLLLLHRMTPAREMTPMLRAMHPGITPGPLSRDLAAAEAGGWDVLEVETLQQDYEDSLRVWIDRLRQNRVREAARTYEHAYRAWLLYLVEIATSLQAEELHVHRVLLRRPRQARRTLCFQ